MISYIWLIISHISIGGYTFYPPMFPLFTPYDDIAVMVYCYGSPTGGQQAARAVPVPF